MRRMKRNSLNVMTMPELMITLHPEAKNLLFNQFALLSKIFTDVLGQLETDYLCITLLTDKNELLLFSSSSGDEWALIEEGRWQHKKRFQTAFLFQEQIQIWDHKEHSPEYGLSLSIPSIFESHRIVYTFATKSRDQSVHAYILNNIARLTRIGQFCLKAILDRLPLFGREPKSPKPQLRLVVDNTKNNHQKDNI